MIVVNFAHPLTAEHRTEIVRLVGEEIERVIDVPTQFDETLPFAPQVAALVAAAGLSPEEWQTLPLVVNLPAYSPIAATLLTYVHGLCGHFPAILRLRPRRGPVPAFDVAEILLLNSIREDARRQR